MLSLDSGLYYQVLCVIFAILLSDHSNGFIKAQQSPNCPANYVLVNGLCIPGSVNQTTTACTISCTATCPTQTFCNCVGMPAMPCANQIITPLPCPNQPVAPLPGQPCPNQPVAPLPGQPCPNQPVIPTPCPNQPVAPLPTYPYPNQPVYPTPCPPNQPVAPLPGQPSPNQPVIPTPCPNQPVAPSPSQPCPSQPIAPTPCPNQPVAPCPNQPVTPLPGQPCPNQPIAPTPCPNQPVAPFPTQPCPNQPIPPVQCPNQPTVPIPQQPCPNQPIPPTPPLPCPNPPVCPTPIPTPCPSTPTPTPTPTPTSAPPTGPSATLPPPAPLRCPAGTIPLNNRCRLIYCNKGVYRDNKCIQTVCPEGTTWTGYKCASVEPIVHSITFNNTIVTHFNRTEPDVIVNNVNNMNVNASVTVPLVPAPELPTVRPNSKCQDNDDAEECEYKNCCTVISPRICQPSTYRPSKWNCYSRRYQRCGDFCVAPIVYLKAPKARETSTYVVVPPDENLAHCRQLGTCPESEDFYDCSGCAAGDAKSCSSYCYNYQCSLHKCNFYDQKEYCNQNPGGNGCQEQDGCIDDWCDGDDDYNAY